MANIELYIPFCIKHEARVSWKRDGETNKEYFERARAKGYVVDSGGPTQTGLTLSTYKIVNPRATVSRLKSISYDEWLRTMKKLFWDKIMGDNIRNQSVADAIMDWYWNSGAIGIKRVQRVVGVTADGIVGAKTISAINSRDPFEVWSRILSARYDYFESLAKQNPTKYKRYLEGWKNRLNEMKYENYI